MIIDMPCQLGCSFVGFRQDLSASQQYFSLTTNQHQPSLAAQKPIDEQAQRRIKLWTPYVHRPHIVKSLKGRVDWKTESRVAVECGISWCLTKSD